MKTCFNCFYGGRNWFEIPCRTCIENSNHENWTGVDEEELKDEDWKARTLNRELKGKNNG